MAREITIKIADNGVLIETITNYGQNDTEVTSEVFEINDCFDFGCAEERKENIGKLIIILWHIADEIGYDRDKYSENNLEIIDEADIKEEYSGLFTDETETIKNKDKQ